MKKLFHGKRGHTDHEVAAYERYVRWCTQLGIQPAAFDKYISKTFMLNHQPIGWSGTR